jgi:hypothetical protein
MPIPYWTIGCIYGASAVTFGAFGAHGLKKRISDPAKIANFATAAHYQVPVQSPSKSLSNTDFCLSSYSIPASSS